jgi:molecular chaperone DnaK (HSP70)
MFLCRRTIAIDLGSEWLKVCLVDSEALELSLLDMVLDMQSNRRNPSLVGFPSDEERVFSDSALSLWFRNPQRAFPALKRLLGRTFDDPEVAAYQASESLTSFASSLCLR